MLTKNLTEEVKDENSKKNEPSWQIDKTDGLGKVYIAFSEPMDVNYTAPFLNSTYLDIKVKPFIGEDDVTNTSRNLNITSWEVLKFKSDQLLLQLKFETPLNVSLNFKYDTLIINIVNQTSIFRTAVGEMIN